ncbi:IMPACT family member YigZ [Marinomonas spartinae]|uniref:IMPACT family member YigZ n=1 Tax=Marinomonas spartinae TaxID=1792290 RepID=A0A1A8TGL7_9GAMM|nr:YigZ family protein [Marinomonas spartinae]SBS31398.1 IMPACT family member YigZ [Marinomonas spartinae]SBS32168.1 IMPACT family member YigZ [Marinomonas spartinae]
MDYYLSPTHTQRFDLEIKNSQFITTVSRTKGREAAKTFLDEIRQRYPDANHHCWAFVAGAPNNVHLWDQSDDGEPKGTAGKPMLNVLQHSSFGETTVVVTRYFGGIKLGAGGLVRAYSQAVQEALTQTEHEHIYPRSAVQLVISYPLLGKVEYWLEQSDIEINNKIFSDNIVMDLAVIERTWPEQKQTLTDLCQGSLTLIESDKE